MSEILIWVGGVAVLAVLSWRQRIHMARERERRIASHVFPASVARKVRETYPQLEPHQLDLVMSGLREYFSIALAAKGRMTAMPSKAVDVAWHEFILCTRAYQRFCKAAFGRFLHHSPADAKHTPSQVSDGVRRTWRLSCAREGLDESAPSRLPMLFAIDQELGIPDGCHYSKDCLTRPDRRREIAIGYSASCGGSSGRDLEMGGDDGGGCGGD